MGSGGVIGKIRLASQIFLNCQSSFLPSLVTRSVELKNKNKNIKYIIGVRKQNVHFPAVYLRIYGAS